MELNGKVVVITGASSGIGLATARLLANHGAKLALVSRSKDKLDKLVRELPNSIAIAADMTNISEVKKMIRLTKEHFGRIDILINNAGQGYDAPIEKTRIDMLEKLFKLYIIGPLVAMQEVIPLMRAKGGGRIINISSGTALMTLPNNGAYSSIKRALASISLTAGEELKKDNITVSVVYPYMTNTDFEQNTVKNDVEQSEGEPPFPPDSAEYVAEKILEAIRSGEGEIFAHDWMKKLGKSEKE